MGKRGQNHEAWLARWRDGACPIHGTGFVVDAQHVAPADAGFVYVRCANDECTVRATQWPGSDEHHRAFGFGPVTGPALLEVRALLAKAGDVDAASEKPGPRARDVRTSYPLEEESRRR